MILQFGLLLLLCTFESSQGSLMNDIVSSAKSLWPKDKDLSKDLKSSLPGFDFELPVEDEDYLKEGLALIGAPREALDICNHRVIQTLKKNCNQLSAEETAKLAVMMLNCQLEIERRPTYPCQPEMSLQQCTEGMDAEAYKVYNFMVNRASGACSAIKQEQFRALTEITINRMMQLTQSQLTAMHEALQNQQKFNEIEIANFEGLNENEEKIRDGQVENLEKLKNVGNLIDENLQHMLEIRKKSEAKFTEMGKSAEVISQKLNQHTTELHVGHEKLIKDVDEISLHLQKSNLELIHQYNQTLEFFQNFKTLMILLSNMTDNIKSFIEKIMLTVHDVGLEFTDEFLASMFLNLIYFTCGMIFMLFINAHGTCKIYLVGLFVYNTAAAYFQPDISLFPMNIFFWLCYIAMKALSIIKKRLAFESFKIDFRPLLARLPKWRWTLKRTRENSESDSDGYYYERSPTPKPSLSGPYKAEECRSNLGLGKSRLTTNYLSAVRTHSKNAVDDNEVGSFFNEINKSPMSIRSNESSSSYTRPSTPLARPRTPAIERILRETIPDRYTPFVTGMAGRIPCTGITAKGLQCKNAAVAGMDKCRLH